MKNITQYIQEATAKHFTPVKPQTKDDLIDIIRDTLKKEGPDADLNFIDTSNIKDMSYLFEYICRGKTLKIRNIKIDKWDVSNVEDMNAMFEECRDFNCDLSLWDVSKVKDMSFMFYDCEKFNSNLSKWDVSNVKEMTKMFYNCEKLNCKKLDNWDISKVENMHEMFEGCDGKLPK